MADALALRARSRWLNLGRAVARPRLTARLLTQLLRAPMLSVALDDTLNGRAIWRAHRRGSALLLLRRFGRSAYAIPLDGRAYRGRSAHGRRNYVTRALAGGLTIEQVPLADVDDLLEKLDKGPLQCRPCAGITLSASDPSSRPLAMMHVHVDREVAQLENAVHISGHEMTGPARYALFSHMVAKLAEAGATVLLVMDNYYTASPGLRQFQRVLGFVPVNVRSTLRSTAARGSEDRCS